MNGDRQDPGISEKDNDNDGKRNYESFDPVDFNIVKKHTYPFGQTAGDLLADATAELPYALAHGLQAATLAYFHEDLDLTTGRRDICAIKLANIVVDGGPHKLEFT